MTDDNLRSGDKHIENIKLNNEKNNQEKVNNQVNENNREKANNQVNENNQEKANNQVNENNQEKVNNQGNENNQVNENNQEKVNNQGNENNQVNENNQEKVNNQGNENNILDDTKIIDLSELFKIFGDSTRIKIINVLLNEELCVNDIASKVNVSQSAISHQLRILKSSKLVKYRKVGNLIYYSLDDDHVKKIFELGCEHINEV